MTRRDFLILYCFSKSSGCLYLSEVVALKELDFVVFDLRSVSEPPAFVYMAWESLFVDMSLKYKHSICKY